MGSLDWAVCYWCDYWVERPYMFDLWQAHHGAICDWCFPILFDQVDSRPNAMGRIEKRREKQRLHREKRREKRLSLIHI